MHLDLEEALAHVLSGEGVLFTGAGFSYKAKNMLPAPDNEIPTARQFAEKLTIEAGKSGQYDLPVIAQFFTRKKGEHELLNEVRKRFTVTAVNDFHVRLASLPWRRVYTTNYDNCFEHAALQSGIDWIPLTLDTAITAASKRCIHVNGHISNLSIENLQSQIKLTHSSYSADSFVNSKWSQQLRQDLNDAKCAIFIGYSMADIDIARVLYRSPELFARTFFIVAPGEDEILTSPLEEYGCVCAIGVEEFAKRTTETQPRPTVATEYEYTWLKPYDRIERPTRPSDKSGLDLITLGEVDPALVAWSLVEPDSPYAFRRSEIDEIQREIESGRTWFLIHSDLGNGKTVLKFQLSEILRSLDYSVFWDTELDLNKSKDIRHLAADGRKTAIFVDETPDEFEAIDGLLSINRPNVLVFVCVRTVLYELGEARYEDFLPENYLPLDINSLGDEDTGSLISLLNRLGLWGNRAGDGPDAKMSFVKVECERRIARVILSLLEKSELGLRLVSSAKPIVNQKDSQLGSLIILCFILNRLGHPPRPNVLSEVLGFDVWKVIKSAAFAKAGEYIRFRDGSITSRSSIISSYLLRKATQPEILIWNIEKFFRRLSPLKRDSTLQHIMTELQRFPMLESLIESPRRREIIIGYYQSISDMNYCQRSALFWLHYAMARLSYGEFKEASLYFEHARSLAKGKPKELIDIENQYARLLIDSRTRSDDFEDFFQAFEMAHGILIAQINKGSNRHFPFRQAKKDVEFISFRKKRLSASDLKQFVTCCKQVQSAIAHLDGPISRAAEVSECSEAMARAIAIASQARPLGV